MIATLALAWQLAREFRPLYEEALARKVRQFGEQDPRSVSAMRDLAAFLMRNQLYAEAEPWLRRLDDSEALGDCLAALNRGPEAAAEYRRNGGPPALAKLAAMTSGAEALTLYRKALALEEKASGAMSPKVAVRLNDVALLSREEVLFRRALAIQEKALGPTHPEAATTMNNLASLLMEKGRVDEAEAMARRAHRVLETSLGRRNVRTAVSASNLADILRARGREAAAVTLYRQALEVFEQSLGAGHAWTREAREALSSGRTQ